MRADFRVQERRKGQVLRFAQELEGSPFERVLREAETTIAVEPGPGGTRVAITIRQRLRGLSRLGGVPRPPRDAPDPRRGARRARGGAWLGACAGGAGATTPTPARCPRRPRPCCASELGIDGAVRGPVALEDVALEPCALGDAALDRLRAAADVRTDREARVLHAAGKGYVDLVRLRAGTPDGAPDAVVAPADAAGVAAVLEVCAAERIAVVPFGGGTSVVGGLTPIREGFAGVVSLDLGRLSGIVADRRPLAAPRRSRAGTQGPELEGLLGAQGYTLGHFPQSFEYVTIGGCVATRSAGQASTGMGRIDELVVGVRLHGAGRRAAARADARQRGRARTCASSLMGSEGAFGVITEATLRIRPRRRGDALRGLDGAVLRRRRRGAARARAVRRRAGRRAALRRRRDALLDDRLGRHGGAPRATCCAATSARAGSAAAAW